MHARSVRAAVMALLGVAWLLLCPGARAETPLPPPPTDFVTDTVGLISPAARDALDARLADYERNSGHQVVVWIGSTIGAAPLEDFAARTFRAWGIGRKGHDDGILMVVLARDRKIAIEVGYGLEDRVPDVTAGRIIDDVMVPRLRAGDADAAVTEGVDGVLSAVEGHAVEPGATTAPAPVHGRPPSPFRGLLFGALGLFFLFLLFTHPSLATYFLFSIWNGGGGFGGGSFGGFGGGGGFRGGGGRSGGGGARGSW
jgi:uncharacterized protein